MQQGKRGFIQIPILIAIIMGISVAGGSGYFIAQKVNESRHVPLTSTETTIASSTEPTPVATIRKEGGVKKDLVIDSMQKQINDLTKIVARQEVTEKTPTQKVAIVEKVSQPEVQQSLPQVATITFPCSKFSALREDIYSTFFELVKMDSDDGTKENPNKDNFDYPYNKLNSQKPSFDSTVARLNQKIDLLDTYDGVSLAKSSLYQAGNRLQEAFNLKIQAYKLVSNDALVYWGGSNVIPPDNIDQAKLNLNQAYVKFTTALDNLTKGITILDGIKKDNNCN